MFDWVTSPKINHEPIPFLSLVVLSGMAILFGLLVALVYSISLPRQGKERKALATTLVLLTTLITFVTLVIGDSQARAFGLVGALSIVRFRTVVEDTRDTAFVIFAVVVGMAIGAGQLTIAALLIPLVTIAALIMRFLITGDISKTSKGALSLRVSLGVDPSAKFAPLFDHYFSSFEVFAVSTVKQGAAVDLVYHVEVKPEANPLQLVSEINRQEGIQSCEWKQIVEQ
ncbi:MAG: DUF4956 domain-containing protein [Gemmataceae bacterium]|nr:DUF4956 domain-containing protein [Gemmataceae bacterium]